MSKRFNLLPPYLTENPAWRELIESLDEVFEAEIDIPISLLSRLRNNWILTEAAGDKIDAKEILESSSDFFSFERELLIRQAGMIGFQFKEADLLSTSDYQRIVRNLGQYWYGKGTPQFIDFLAFCLNSTLEVSKLWSTQGLTYDTYGPMLEEGDAGIGTSVQDGGDWFETSHVNLTADPAKFATSQVSKLVALFNALANYDLVLNSIVFDTIANIHTVGDDVAVCVKSYPMIDIETTIFTSTSALVDEDGIPLVDEDDEPLITG